MTFITLQVLENSLECEVQSLVKLIEFQRIQSSYFEKTYYLQNLYNATFVTNDNKLKTFVVFISEGEVYRYQYLGTSNLVSCSCYITCITTCTFNITLWILSF